MTLRSSPLIRPRQQGANCLGGHPYGVVIRKAPHARNTASVVEKDSVERVYVVIENAIGKQRSQHTVIAE